MSVGLLTPDIRRIIGALERRLGVLERRITGAGAVTDESHSVFFSYAGPLAATVSPPARVWRGGILTVLAVTLETAGSTATVIDIVRNGTAVATVTVPASTETYNGQVSARFVADVDVLALEITTVGTGANNMTAEARFT